MHGHKRTDHYYWMRDDERKHPEIIDHLNVENNYLKSMMVHTETFQEKLYSEMIGRLKKEDSSVPVRMRGYWYQAKFDKNHEYPVHVRRKDHDNAKEEILFDVNEMAKEYSYFNLGGYYISPDNKIAVFATDTLSRRIYTIEFKDLSTGKILKDKLECASDQVFWANDNQTVFYIKKDMQTLLGNKIYRHKLGTDQKDDVLVYEENDSIFYTFLGKSKDESTFFIYHNSTNKAGVSILDANDPNGDFKLFTPLEKNHEYSIEKIGDYFYIYTNLDAVNFRIMKVHKDKTADKKAWIDVVAQRENVFIAEYAVFNNFLVVEEKENGETRVRVININTRDSKDLKFDDPVFDVNIVLTPDINNTNVRINYSSLIRSNTVYEFDLISGKRTLLKQDEIKGGFNPNDYQIKRIFIDARDGVKVPVSLVYKKDLFNMDGSNPLFQYAYGSYGITIEPSFSSTRLSLLDRGVVYAIAHVRGSQMMGRPWYDNGKFKNKKNSFTDFIDTTKALVELGYGGQNKIYAMGGSAGGLLMGAVLNMAPELYLGVGAHVPFVDVMTTMLDTSIPLTTNEYDEWGNPNDKEFYDYILSYSPYDNVKKQAYPNILVTTGLHDSQVQYFEPMKWVAKLREYKTDNNLLLFETDMEAGHGGASGRFTKYKKTALEYAFFFDLLGIKE
jgi:oligopeptidase B